MLLTPAEKLKGLTITAASTKLAAELHVVSLNVALIRTRLAVGRRGGTAVMNQIVTWEHTSIHIWLLVRHHNLYSARLCLCVWSCGGVGLCGGCCRTWLTLVAALFTMTAGVLRFIALEGMQQRCKTQGAQESEWKVAEVLHLRGEQRE